MLLNFLEDNPLEMSSFEIIDMYFFEIELTKVIAEEKHNDL